MDKENPYFRLFKGEVVSKKEIEDHSPETLSAVHVLVADGRIVGQYNQESEDIELFMPEFLREKRRQKFSPAPHEREILQKKNK